MTKTIQLLIFFIGFNLTLNAQTTDCKKTCTVDKIIYEDAFLGVQLASPCHIDVKKGVAILKVIEQTVAEENDIRVLDIIYAINGKKVNKSNELIKIIKSYNPFDEVKLNIIRDEKEIVKNVKLGAKTTKIIQEKICCDDTSSILNADNIELYPNPAVNNLNIKFKAVVKDEYTFSVYSTNGVLISTDTKNINTKDLKYTLPVNKLPDGVYVLKIVSQQKTFSKLFVVNKD